MTEKHWTQINPFLGIDGMDSGSIFPHPVPSINTTAYNHIFKYMIGDKLIEKETGDIYEITGFNYFNNTYQGNIIMNFGNKIKTVQTNYLFESRLNQLEMYNPKATIIIPKDDKAINYRIYYFEEGSNKSVQKDVQLSSIRALARLLNSMVKIDPKRRIIMVCILDSNGVYVEQVKFMKKEFRDQKFLTGMKERLLAHAKYECGYEVATNF